MRSTVIGKDTFVVLPISPMESFALFPLWAPALGQAIRQLATAAQVSGLLAEVDLDDVTLDDLKLLLDKGNPTLNRQVVDALIKYGPDLAAALGQTIGMLKPSDLVTLTRALLAGATKNGVPLFPVAGEDTAFNRQMKGNVLVIMRLFLFALQVNYMDFSSAAPDDEPSAAAVASPS